MSAPPADHPAEPHDEPTLPAPVRRDFLTLLTVATAGVGAAAFAWPFIDSLQGGANEAPADAIVDVDLRPIAPGQQITVVWSGKPIFIIRRTPQALERLRDAALQARLRDPGSAEMQQPAYAANWHRSTVPEIGVFVGICTHLGCVPRYRPAAAGNAAAPDTNAGWPGGYACPCHGSRFDLAGRVFRGAPAPYNLPVPPYSLPDPSRLRIGENPAGQPFDFQTIRQI